ncbi:MAG: type II toxin-antitoxin system Phd/YefM family antitoxin [bacterium]|nr:type II toxin-antitoxin system Phd/YefM family antitoxin [bacterium]
MKSIWALQDAKNRLSEVVEHALKEGPQTITRRGKETVVIVSIEDFQKLTATRGSLLSFFQKSPLSSANLDLTRPDDYGREIAL